MHRPLSNLGYSFFSVAEDSGLSESQLRNIGASGVWIIGTRDIADSTPYNRKAVTHYTKANDINLVSESVIANADAIALELCSVGQDIVGCSNISESLLGELEMRIFTLMDPKLNADFG